MSSTRRRDADAEEKARGAVDAFFEAFNAQDQDAHRAALNYPHVRLASGRVRVVSSPDDFDVPFDRLKASEGWHHSTLDRCEPIHADADKVHFDVAFSRYKADGTRYATHEAIWIITNHAGHWGVQCRSSYAP